MRPDPPRYTPPVKPAYRKKKRRRVKTFTWAPLFLLFAVVGGFLGFLIFYSSRSNRSVGEVFSNLFDKPFNGKSQVRILMLGVDDKVEHGRSDTIILTSIDFETKTIRGISIPRDTRVQIPGYDGHQKINASFTHGGAALTRQTVEQLVGVPIDGYVKTNIAGFKGIVDTIGGVDLTVDKNMRYTDRAQGLYIRLKKGYQHLDGEKAMQYVRFRHDTMGDLTRIKRQQNFLKAVVRKLQQPSSWPKIPGIIARSHEFVETDILPKDLTALAELARDVKLEQVRMETLPGVPENIRGVSYFVADADETARMVRAMLLPSPVSASVPRPPVQILNGNGTAGIAAQAGEILRQSGYQVISTGNADHFGYQSSQVITTEDRREGAQGIIQVLGCGSVVVSHSGDSQSPVTVILGKDFHPMSN